MEKQITETENNLTTPNRKGFKSRIKLLLSISIPIILIALIAVGVRAYQIKQAVEQTAKEIHVSVPQDIAPKVALKESEPISILLLGLDTPWDTSTHDLGRSDTMILLTIDPKLKKTTMVSIPRDIRVHIEDRGFQKINAVWTFGEVEEEGKGIETATAFVSEMFDIPIHYVAQINFRGFSDLVTAIGGIEVDNAFEFTTSKYHFPAGEIELNGPEALAYVRMRYQDPLSEVGRQARQRMVLQEIFNKLNAFAIFSDYREIFDAVEKNVRTNLTLNEMYQLKNDYASSIGEMEPVVIETTSASIAEVTNPQTASSYQRLSFEERIRITNILRESLRLPRKDISEYEQNIEELSNPIVKENS